MTEGRTDRTWNDRLGGREEGNIRRGQELASDTRGWPPLILDLASRSVATHTTIISGGEVDMEKRHRLWWREGGKGERRGESDKLAEKAWDIAMVSALPLPAGSRFRL
jgi:hypothetical protein